MIRTVFKFDNLNPLIRSCSVKVYTVMPPKRYSTNSTYIRYAKSFQKMEKKRLNNVNICNSKQ